MQNEHTSKPKEGENATSSRVERLLKHLQELWVMPHELTFETMKRIITQLPEEDQATGIEVLAEYLVATMKFHFLDIMATFHQKAKEEGEICAEERDEIARDVRQEPLQTMLKLDKRISVKSFDDLVRLSNITFGLYNLSQVESAEQGERWMYKLPRLYQSRLETEHLLVEPPHVTVKVSADQVTSAITWNIAFPQLSGYWQIYNPQGRVSSQFQITQRSHLVA